MTIRKRFYIGYTILILSFIAIVTLAALVSQWFLIPLLIVIYYLFKFGNSIRCPKCNKLLMFNYNIGLTMPAPLSECRHCGADLSNYDCKAKKFINIGFPADNT